ITGIRGSLVVAEVSGSDSDVTVLEAHRPITIAPRSNSTQTTQLPVGHTVRVSGPPHAPRFGQIRRALRERLSYVADRAEVPGRPPPLTRRNVSGRARTPCRRPPSSRSDHGRNVSGPSRARGGLWRRRR